MRNRLPWVLALAGLVGGAVAIAVRPTLALAGAGQDYPAFALVAGLLLIGLVADDDGLFAAAGRWLARLTANGVALFAGAAVIIASVTATLNLDTSVAFLTPVLIYTARERGTGEAALLYGCLMLSNAGSLLLPGANLTNLIVLGQLRLGGGEFLARMWLPALAALVVTAVVVAGFERDSLLGEPAVSGPGQAKPLVARRRPGTAAFWQSPQAESLNVRRGSDTVALWRSPGLGAVVVATVLVLTLSAPALPVLALGVLVAGLHLAWSGPVMLASRLDSAGTAALAAIASLAVNNLPAASLMAARAVPHPFSVLVGLNVGPNLCVTGSLAWLLWLKSARRAGAAPSLTRASLIGGVAVPTSMAAALAGLAITSH